MISFMIVINKIENTEDIYNIIKDNAYIVDVFKTKDSIYKYASKLNNNGFLFSACKEENVVGFICGYANDIVTKKAYISFLYIEQNNGLQNAIILNKLFKKTSDYLHKQGMKTIRAEVQNRNSYAINIYNSLGFKKVEDASESSFFIEADL